MPSILRSSRGGLFNNCIIPHNHHIRSSPRYGGRESLFSLRKVICKKLGLGCIYAAQRIPIACDFNGYVFSDLTIKGLGITFIEMFKVIAHELFRGHVGGKFVLRGSAFDVSTGNSDFKVWKPVNLQSLTKPIRTSQSRAVMNVGKFAKAHKDRPTCIIHAVNAHRISGKRAT